MNNYVYEPYKTCMIMKKLAIILLGCCVSLMLWNCKGKSSDGSSDVDNALAERMGLKEVPKVEKFVVVTADQTPVLREPAKGSAILVNCMEDMESDMADSRVQWSDEKVPRGYSNNDWDRYAGTVLAVLGEEGDYYKVSVKDREWCDIESGYVLKSDTEEMKPEAVTAEWIEESAEQTWMPTVVKKEGKYKGLVIRVEVNELWGEETLWVGVLKDGVIYYPDGFVGLIADCDTADELVFRPAGYVDDINLQLQYPKSVSKLNEFGEVMSLDPAKLTDEQIEQILEELGKRPTEYIGCEYSFPMTEGQTALFWLKK